MTDPRGGRRADRRVADRVRRRLWLALLIGPPIGVATGALIGWIAFGRWGGGMVLSIVAATIASTILGLLWAGYSSLESPDPGKEPSDTRRPIADRPELVREETGDPPIPERDRPR